MSYRDSGSGLTPGSGGAQRPFTAHNSKVYGTLGSSDFSCANPSSWSPCTQRINNRPKRSESKKNHETVDKEYEQNVERQSKKSQNHLKGNLKRNGSSNWTHLSSSTEVTDHRVFQPAFGSTRKTNAQRKHMDKCGTYDPIKNQWTGPPLSENFSNSASNPNEELRPSKGRHACHRMYSQFDLTHNAEPRMLDKKTWALEVRAGETGKRVIESPKHQGQYNPITNEWINPPRDARFLDREHCNPLIM